MKYILFIIGVILGKIIAPFITDSGVIQWVIRLSLGILGYNIPLFISYTRMSPKKLLEFHGEDAPLTRSNSPGELQTFLHQLKKGGLLIDICSPQVALVDKVMWEELTNSEKLCFSKIISQLYKLNSGTDSLEIKSAGKEDLATYSLSEGLKNL